MSILVSIIVLTYNSYSTLMQTLESILNQTVGYEDKVEIIIGDDCSTDRTKELLHECEKKYGSMLKVIYNEKNVGVVRNYFNLIGRCRGDYIMECAGDDYWLPGKIKEQVQYMIDNPDVGMCCGNAVIFDEKKNIFIYRTNSRKDVDYLSLLLGNTIFAPTVCIRKEVIDEYIKEVMPLNHNWAMEDYPMWLWISKNKTIKYIDNNYAVYRIGNSSISHNKELDKQLAFEKNTVDIQKYFISNEKERDIVEHSHDIRMEDIYLKYNCRKEYRDLVGKKPGKKNRIKYYMSYLPGYTYCVNLKRDLTQWLKTLVKKDRSELVCK